MALAEALEGRGGAVRALGRRRRSSSQADRRPAAGAGGLPPWPATDVGPARLRPPARAGPPRFRPALSALFALVCLASTLASEGDSLPAHRGCVYHCRHGDAPRSLRLVDGRSTVAGGDGDAGASRWAHTLLPFEAPDVPRSSLCLGAPDAADGPLDGVEVGSGTAGGELEGRSRDLAGGEPAGRSRDLAGGEPAGSSRGLAEGEPAGGSGGPTSHELAGSSGGAVGGELAGGSGNLAEANGSARMLPSSSSVGAGRPPPGEAGLLRLGWTCASDCDHLCTRAVEGSRLAAGGRPVQYHGKWDFARLWGAQEPASVALSLANLAAHAWGFSRVRRAESAAATPRGRARAPSWIVLLFFLTSSLAWACSAAFHARDLPATERADYLCAGASVGAGALLAAQRALRATSPRSVGALAVTLLAPLIVKGHSMVSRRFDYGGWMGLCGALLAVQVVGWTAVLARGWRESGGDAAGDARPRAREQDAGPAKSSGAARRPLVRAWPAASPLRPPPAVAPLAAALSLLLPATLLEVFDFPPVGGVIDAHAAWHAATVPVTVLLYRFLAVDASRAGKAERD